MTDVSARVESSDPARTDPAHSNVAALEKAAAKAGAAWLTAQAGPARNMVRLTIGSGILGGLLIVAQAYLLAWILSAVIIDGRPLDGVLLPIGLLAAVYLARAAAAYGMGLAGFAAAARVRQEIRQAVCEKIHDLGPSIGARTEAGAQLSVALDQVEALEGYFARYLPQKTIAAFVPLAMSAAVFPVDWLAGVIFLVTLPLVPVFMAIVGMGAAAASRRQAQSLARMSGFFLDRLRNLDMIKRFGQAERELAAVKEISENYRDRALRVLRLAFLSSAVLEFFAVIAIALVALYIGMSLLQLFHLGPANQVTLFIGLFVLVLAPEVFLPLRKLAVYYHERGTALAAAEQLRHILEMTPPAPLPEGGKTQAPHGCFGIRIKNLSKSFDGGSRPVLADFNLDVAPGEKIALVGASGAGKSTVLSLLMGFDAPDQGSLELTGPDAPAGPPGSWPVAWLGQSPHLFHGSLRDNIALGCPGDTCDDGAIQAAAEAAEVMGFAARLPDGLDSPIGEEGQGISGGEAQRVALARAFLRDAPIVLLDEPTARLDRENEQAVLAALDRLMPGRTVIAATHSPAVIARMDRVIEITPLTTPPGGHQETKPGAARQAEAAL